jgi:serine phosphatase RsbU (regulator of sigma subunit)
MRLSTTASPQQIAADIGSDVALVFNRAKAYGIPFEEAEDGTRSFAIADAVALVERFQVESEAHSAKNRAYNAYVEECRRKAYEKRLEDARAAREEARLAEAKSLFSFRKKRALATAEQTARMAEEHASLNGNPMSFEKFAKKAPDAGSTKGKP